MKVRKSLWWLAAWLLVVTGLPAAWGASAPSPCFPPTTACYMVQYSGSAPDGTSLALRTNFPLNATNNLVVNLSSIFDVLDSPDILSALGFTLLHRSTLVNLTPAALLTSGNAVFYDPDGRPAGANVLGERGITFQGTQQGVPSASSRIFGNPNLSGPDPAFPAVTASDTDNRIRGQSPPLRK